MLPIVEGIVGFGTGLIEPSRGKIACFMESSVNVLAHNWFKFYLSLSTSVLLCTSEDRMLDLGWSYPILAKISLCLLQVWSGNF